MRLRFEPVRELRAEDRPRLRVRALAEVADRPPTTPAPRAPQRGPRWAGPRQGRGGGYRKTAAAGAGDAVRGRLNCAREARVQLRRMKAERDSRLVKWSLGGVRARLWRSEMALMLSDVSPFLRFGAAGPLSKPPFLARQGRSDQISRLSVSSDPDTPIGAKYSSAKNGRSPRPARLQVRQRTENRRHTPGHQPNDWRRRRRRRERTMTSRRTFDGHSSPALEPSRWAGRCRRERTIAARAAYLRGDDKERWNRTSANIIE